MSTNLSTVGGPSFDSVRDLDPQILLQTWRTLPVVNPTLTFDSLLVPSSKLQAYVQHPSIQTYLAKPSNAYILQHVHPRIKLVQEHNDTHKKILLLPLFLDDLIVRDELLHSLILDSHNESPNNNNEVLPIIQFGERVSMSLSYQQLSFHYILQQLLPYDLLPPPSAYEQIGHVAHFNLKEPYAKYQQLIGQVLVETTSSIETVVQKVGSVSGRYRTYPYKILANQRSNSRSNDENENKNETNDISCLETTVVEDGLPIQLNVAECYWCTRLSGERQAILKEIMSTTTILNQQPLVVADVFCGVGAVCLLLAKKRQQQEQQQHAIVQQQPSPNKRNKTKNAQSCSTRPPSSSEPIKTSSSLTHIIANDWNAKAIGYFEKSIKDNNLDPAQFQLSCIDAYDFLIELGCVDEDKDDVPQEIDERLGNVAARKLGADHNSSTNSRNWKLPHHVLMNFPSEAPKFLSALRWWSWERVQQQFEIQGGSASSSASYYPRFHVYTFARATTIGGNNEEEVAVDLVANELLPPIASSSNRLMEGLLEVEQQKQQHHRREELNEEFGAQVSTRQVRDVAPGKVVVCVSFSLTPKLIRYMQGDYF